MQPFDCHHVLVFDGAACVPYRAIERAFHHACRKLIDRDENGWLAAAETRPFGDSFMASRPTDHRVAACPLGADFHDVMVGMQHGERLEDFESHGFASPAVPSTASPGSVPIVNSYRVIVVYPPSRKSSGMRESSFGDHESQKRTNAGVRF